MTLVNLTKRSVDAARPKSDKPIYLFDRVLTGFGLRVTPNGVRSYFAQYRLGKGRRAKKVRQFIGRHGAPLTPDQARKEAERILSRVKLGENPHAEQQAEKQALTVQELCNFYLAKAEAGEIRTRSGRQKKSSTLATDRGRIKRHIVPLLGRKLAKNVTNTDVVEFLNAVAVGKTRTIITRQDDPTIKTHGRVIVDGGEGTASRTVGLLGAIFTFAVRQGISTNNPVRGVFRPEDGKRNRYLDAEEYHALGEAVLAARREGVNATALAAIEFLALTGMRKSEALQLRRANIDRERRIITLEDSKTGLSVRPIGRGAMDLIKSLPRNDKIFVFPATGGGKAFVGLPKIFDSICDRAKLSAVTLHTLRHSLATAANDLGLSEPTIAAILGHARHSMTSRYTHVIDATLLAATDRVCAWIAAALGGKLRDDPKVVSITGSGLA